MADGAVAATGVDVAEGVDVADGTAVAAGVDVATAVAEVTLEVAGSAPEQADIANSAIKVAIAVAGCVRVIVISCCQGEGNGWMSP